jgi:hypothetical protein
MTLVNFRTFRCRLRPAAVFRPGLASPGPQQGHDGCQFSNQLQHDIDELNGSVPLFSVRVLLVGIDDLETARERDAQAARNRGESGLDIIAVSDLQRGSRRQAIEDRLQLDLLIDLPKGLNAFLQPFGDRKVERLDDSRPFALAAATPRSRRS